MAVQADVTEMASVEAMRDAINVELGPADIIVDNAVVQYDWVPVLDQPLERFRESVPLLRPAQRPPGQGLCPGHGRLRGGAG